jgi:hypothetical protein
MQTFESSTREKFANSWRKCEMRSTDASKAGNFAFNIENCSRSGFDGEQLKSGETLELRLSSPGAVWTT